ncbi:hypothetical protein GCM10011607_35940 [Shewanella inventionis]|uniref:Uncharacterized protein n=1 Tax=Shewanella inventionis TaxID=1738770 RepID=A0ABQ1JQM0_9GAMM|nr:hypothetical protein GCM10011607_35940 [Shewanella inventionis]
MCIISLILNNGSMLDFKLTITNDELFTQLVELSPVCNDLDVVITAVIRLVACMKGKT